MNFLLEKGRRVGGKFREGKEQIEVNDVIMS